MTIDYPDTLAGFFWLQLQATELSVGTRTVGKNMCKKAP